MSLPATYRKLVATELTRDFRAAAQIVDVPFPQPGADEVVIRNLYAGVNATDPNITAGLYTPGAEPPIDLGAEAVGEIVAVGADVSNFKPGDPVMTMTTGGGYREYQVVRASRAFAIPAATPEIMTLILSGATALVGLEMTGEMRSGENVLITAAAGGTGHIAVQLAKAAGNHVIGTCSTPEKADLLKSLGCDRVINYKEEDVDAVLREEYPRGVNLVYESVGGQLFDTCVDHLARRGRLVIIGYVTEYAGPPQVVTAPRIYRKLLWKSASVRSMFLPHFIDRLPDAITRLGEMMLAGKLHVQVDPTEFRGMDAIVDAVEYLQSGQSAGKVTVRF